MNYKNVIKSELQMKNVDVSNEPKAYTSDHKKTRKYGYFFIFVENREFIYFVN